ncbi:hybrid signal transduction histidine kinase L-like [Musca vetustissima]|uniref:hybrid signal transduction histidine kinase L-like n=1 Tax=Musca vetustissima TaxID=27455 RepID=UPI002AB6D8A5|nr:hybrid signal transduction histidine kinase L-like [Musca vetustissima]
MEHETFYDNQHADDEDVFAVRSRRSQLSYQNEAIPLLSHARIIEQQRQQQLSLLNATNNILSSRLSPDINAMNISTTAYHQQQQQQQHHHQHSQQYQRLHQQPIDQDVSDEQQQQHQSHNNGKRDILLKIRHQIFERKRLREKGYEPHHSLNGSAAAAQVWRPW